MSQSSIVQRKSSPCCIGCVILLIIGIGIAAAMGIWGYRYVRENVEIHSVASISDPSPDAQPEVLFPETVGEFTRVALNDENSEFPNMNTTQTSGIVTAKYENAEAKTINAVAISTEHAQELRRDQAGPLTMGRSKANAPDIAIALKNIGGPGSTTLTWTKPNWTFMLYTTSTLAGDFVKAYGTERAQSGATGEVDGNPSTPTDSMDAPAPASTPAPADTPEPASEPAATPEAATDQATTETL